MTAKPAPFCSKSRVARIRPATLGPSVNGRAAAKGRRPRPRISKTMHCLRA